MSDTELYLMAKHKLNQFYNGQENLSPSELKRLGDYVEHYNNLGK
jgi:hypothetical protein